MSTDTFTTSYQAALLDPRTRDDSAIYSQLPDQFTQYESNIYDPLDFYTSSGQFSLSAFNKSFREEQLKRINFFRNQEIKRLEQLQREQAPKPDLHQLSIDEHMFKLKDTFFGIWSDVQTEPLTVEIITKNNRIFYIGLLLVIIFVLYLVIRNLTTIIGGTPGKVESKGVRNYNFY